MKAACLLMHRVEHETRESIKMIALVAKSMYHSGKQKDDVRTYESSTASCPRLSTALISI